MDSDLAAKSIAAIAVVVAAFMAAALSFINLTLTKEQKTSEFRQAWIDDLRRDLAAFFATVRAFARASQELVHYGKGSKDGAPLAFTEDAISALRYQVAETKYRIQLRLNPIEKEHIELLRLMDAAVKQQQLVLDGKGTTEQTLDAVETAVEYSRGILKTEWKRVKKGEVAFRATRNWIAPTVFILAAGFVVYVWFVAAAI